MDTAPHTLTANNLEAADICRYDFKQISKILWILFGSDIVHGFKSLTVALGYSASCAGGAFVFDELTGVATWEGHWAKILRIKKLIEVDTPVWSGESYKTALQHYFLLPC